MLDRFDEIEFLKRFQIPGKKEVPAGYSMYCPHCTEGTAKHRRRVAYILTGNQRNNFNTFSCRRCPETYSFKKFLEKHQPALHEEYVEKEKLVRLQQIKDGQRRPKEVPKSEVEYELEYIDLPDTFMPATDHFPAVKYCRSRLIPEEVIKKLYFAHKIVELDEIGEVKCEYKNMLVFPFYAGDKVYGYQARCITEKLFYTQSLEGFKVYNFYNVDPNINCYIFEAIIDSLFIENSIAMVGSDIPNYFLDNLYRSVFCFDNDGTSATYRKQKTYLDRGHKIVIWPDEIQEKDVNEMICAGVSSNDVKSIIEENIYSGIAAEIRLGILEARKKRR